MVGDKDCHLAAFQVVMCCFHFRVMEKDPFHANCLPVHIGTLVELNKANGETLCPQSYSLTS